MESGNGQGGGASINATTNPERSLNPRSLLPGQNDDWVMYPLDEFAITTITEVITDLVASAGISFDLDPADLIANWGAETDADPAVADEAAAKESSSLRLKPGVIHRAPRLLLKILRHNPNRWRWEERSLRNRLGRLQQRAAQAGSLNDEDLLALVDDITDLFQECLHDGAMYYGLGLAWTNWRTNRLLRKRPDASDDLADNILTYYLQLLAERRSRLSSLFRQYQELNEDAQHLHLPERLEEIPETDFLKTQNPADLENLILEKLRTLPKGRRFESRIDAFLSDLPVPLEQLDWSFSPRMKLPPRLLVIALSSEPVDGLDGSSRGTNVAKRVAKKLPLRKRPRWNRLVTKTQRTLTGAVGTVFLLLEIVPVFHQAFDEVARRMLEHRRVATPEDLVLLKFDEISKSLLGREPQHELVARRRAEHREKMAERRAKQANAAEIGEEDGNATPVSLAKLFSPSGQGNPRTGMS